MNIYSMDYTNNGEYVMAGSDFISSLGYQVAVLHKLSSTCDSLWYRYIGFPDFTVFRNVVQTKDEGYFLVGNFISTTNARNSYFVKTDSLGLLSNNVGVEKIKDKDFDFVVYPNPVIDQAFIYFGKGKKTCTFQITNLQGVVLVNQEIKTNEEEEILLDVHQLMPGIQRQD